MRRLLTGHGNLAAILAILAAGLGVRLATAIRNPAPEGDGMAANILLADNLNRGLGFTTFLKWTLYDESMDHLRPEANRQPLLPLLLSAVFRFTGPGMRPAQAVAIAIGMLCLVVFHRWAAITLGGRVALLSLGYLALDPPFVWFSTQPDCLLLYTALLFLALIAAGNGEVSWKRTVVLGVISGLAYMSRTQGLILAFSMGLWLLIRGGRARLGKAALFTLIFLAVSMPWFARNAQAFGSPLYSQNSQFVMNENHWSAWSVRSSPPGPGDMLRNQGAAACAVYMAKGAARVLEPFGPGSTGRGEPFGQPTMAFFLVFAMLSLGDPQLRRKLVLPAIVALPLMAALTVHQHSGRYMAPVYAMVAAFGFAGAVRHETRVRGLLPALVLVAALVLLRPLGEVLGRSSGPRAREAMEAARWLRDSTPESSWVVTYPNVELYHWVYRRPTVTWPNDYEALLWPYLEGHRAEYLAVDPDLPALRPWLSRRWRRSPDGREWDLTDPPDFLTEVWRSSSGSTIIYRFDGRVPEGYMAVDSLPPDNMRALGP